MSKGTYHRHMGRRTGSVAGVVVAAVGLTLLAPLWVPLAVVVDLVRLKPRLPIARLLGFAWAWAWLEVVGVLAAAGLWVSGRGRHQAAHYRLQRWWARRLLAALRVTCGLRVEVDGLDVVHPGPVVLLARHASLADSLVTASVVADLAAMRPRFVLKRELLADPCLDIVGNRIPNHFVDRDANDSAPELAALSALMEGAGEDDAGVIFPEGTRANPAKRARAFTRIAERDPDRAERLAGMRHLLPPRPAGTMAMLRGAPSADIVVAWHVGFEGLDTFGGILRALATPTAPIHYALRRVPRAHVPDLGDVDEFTRWLDAQWMQMDAEVHDALARRGDRRQEVR